MAASFFLSRFLTEIVLEEEQKEIQKKMKPRAGEKKLGPETPEEPPREGERGKNYALYDEVNANSGGYALAEASFSS